MTDENIDYSKFICKTRLSPIDERDWIAEQIHPNLNEIKLPIVLDYRFDQLPIRNQGEQGSCAAHAACVMKEWQELKNIDLNEYMSPQFIYNNRENQDSEGMYGRDLMKIMQKIGSVEEDKYKYGKIENPESIPTSIYNRAKNYRIKGYARIETIEGLKVALKKNGPCYISFPVYNYGKEFWHPKTEDELWWGGHAVAVVAYDTSGFWLKNSWGVKWNGNGYTRYPFEHWGEHWEIFTTIDDTSSIIFDDEILKGTITKIRSTMDEYRNDASLFLGGLPMIRNDVIAYITSDLIIFSLAVVLIMSIILAIIFHNIRWVLMPIMISVTGALLMTGFIGAIGWKVTVISANFFSLLLVMTLSVTIHLVVRYRELAKNNPEAELSNLIRQTLEQMIRPCWLTTITTIAAFASLTTVSYTHLTLPTKRIV